LPDYDVSLAQKIMPAADLSQQISTAGMEASGTGNMKLALNGALTIGTLDGANIEIRDHVGEENMFIFGLTAEQSPRARRGLSSHGRARGNPELREALELIDSGSSRPSRPDDAKPVVAGCSSDGEPFLVLADFAAYAAAQDRVDALYAQPEEWSRKAARQLPQHGLFLERSQRARVRGSDLGRPAGESNLTRRSPTSISTCSARAGTSASTTSSARIRGCVDGAAAWHSIRRVGAERRTCQRGRAVQSMERKSSRHAAARILGHLGASFPESAPARPTSSRSAAATDGCSSRRIRTGLRCSCVPRTAPSSPRSTNFEWHDARVVGERERASTRGAAHSMPTKCTWVPGGGPGTPAHPPFMDWREAVEQLIPYAKDMGYTHLELMGVAEHPLDASWGYQVVGYYAATARYGSPQDLMYFVDCCHQAGHRRDSRLGAGAFSARRSRLAQFDGTRAVRARGFAPRRAHGMGHQDLQLRPPRGAQFPDRQCLVLGDRYHVDGLRVDAVASMLYRDYSRKAGEWLPNQYGGRENLEAIEFLRQMNDAVHRAFPGILTIAEESTSFAGVTSPRESADSDSTSNGTWAG
jgi:hypothetical protein